MLAKQIPRRENSGPVTFAELHRAGGIELYVITMDLATGLPVVFCRRTTPDVEVAGAVAASAAIPGAFPAGRAVFDAAGHGAVVHQLVDGSSWANYPSFVFQDRSFRTWLAGEAQVEQAWSDSDLADWELEMSRPLIGYILGDPEPLEYRNSDRVRTARRPRRESPLRSRTHLHVAAAGDVPVRVAALERLDAPGGRSGADHLGGVECGRAAGCVPAVLDVARALDARRLLPVRPRRHRSRSSWSRSSSPSPRSVG